MPVQRDSRMGFSLQSSDHPRTQPAGIQGDEAAYHDDGACTEHYAPHNQY